jgi:hypothetical protein
MSIAPSLSSVIRSASAITKATSGWTTTSFVAALRLMRATSLVCVQLLIKESTWWKARRLR